MSVIGPRPQLVRDMVFMTPEQRRRHTAKPGLSGLAQVNGRNAISWEDKIEWDLKYIEKVSLVEDIKIIFKTVEKAFVKQEGILLLLGDGADYAELKEEYGKKQNVVMTGSVNNVNEYLQASDIYIAWITECIVNMHISQIRKEMNPPQI